MDEQMILYVMTIEDGYSAIDIRGNTYKIDSIFLGSGKMRKPVKYQKFFLQEKTECKASLLKNGKINII
jgi:hypothetical protein